MLFKKEILQNLDWKTPEDYEVISDEIVDKHRWYIRYERIFKFENKFFRTFYNVGATEYQEMDMYQDEPDEIECKEVFPVEKTIVVYE